MIGNQAAARVRRPSIRDRGPVVSAMSLDEIGRDPLGALLRALSRVGVESVGTEAVSNGEVRRHVRTVTARPATNAAAAWSAETAEWQADEIAGALDAAALDAQSAGGQRYRPPS